jgi:hypothetical protein
VICSLLRLARSVTQTLVLQTPAFGFTPGRQYNQHHR